MKFYIPTYEECIQIVESNPDNYFYEKKFLLNDYNISIFGYRYAKWNNFMMPIENSNINALELKGLTFVFNDDGGYNQYLLLHKFWEIDQYNFCRYELYKNKNIKNITIKEDGFLVSFLKLPSGDITSFTKRGLYDTINYEVNQFLNSNQCYFNFVSDCLDNKIQPIFEFISESRYVKYHDKNKLILLKLRDNITGKYIDIYSYGVEGIDLVSRVDDISLDEIIKLSVITQNCEGWVVHFDDDEMIKIKTKWWKEVSCEKKIL